MASSDILTLPELKDFLNITTNTYDTELGSFVSRASQAWVTKVGPVAGSPTYDEWYDGGGSRIVLRHTPVQSITTITEAYQTSLAFTLTEQTLDGTASGGAYGYTLDKGTGTVARRINGVPVGFANGFRNIHIVYVAGYVTTPDDIKLAVADIARDMWQTQRGPGRSRGSGADTEVPPMGLWPRRAQDIANSYLVPGIA